MNIFYLDKCPVKAAQMQCDKHVVKMILESAQLMSAANHILGFPKGMRQDAPYKLTHKNHPCSIWARQSDENYRWLAEHALGLCKEYTLRYEKEHASQWRIEEMSEYEMSFPNKGFTSPAQAMPEEYKDKDPVVAYRNYYWNDKRHNIKMTWKKSRCPEWWIDAQEREAALVL